MQLTKIMTTLVKGSGTLLSLTKHIIVPYPLESMLKMILFVLKSSTLACRQWQWYYEISYQFIIIIFFHICLPLLIDFSKYYLSLVYYIIFFICFGFIKKLCWESLVLLDLYIQLVSIVWISCNLKSIGFYSFKT